MTWPCLCLWFSLSKECGRGLVDPICEWGYSLGVNGGVVLGWGYWGGGIGGGGRLYLNMRNIRHLRASDIAEQFTIQSYLLIPDGETMANGLVETTMIISC